MIPKLVYATLGLLCYLLVEASTTSGRPSERARKLWSGYLNKALKRPFLAAMPKPGKDIPQTKNVPGSENDALAEKVGDVHSWCLQSLSGRKGDLFWAYVALIREWFPYVIPCVYHSPFEGSVKEFGVTSFHTFSPNTLVITISQKKKRRQMLARAGVRGIMVRNLVRGGSRVQKGQPVFLYLQMPGQAWGNPKSDMPTSPRKKKLPEQRTHHSARFEKQASLATGNPELSYASKPPSKRTRIASRTSIPKNSPTMKPSMAPPPKQVTKSPVYQAIISAQPPQPLPIIPDEPAAVDTGISQFLNQSVDNALSPPNPSIPHATPKSGEPFATLHDAPRLGTSQSLDSAIAPPSETPTPSAQESTVMPTTTLPPTNTFHGLSSDQIYHLLSTSRNPAQHYSQAEMDYCQPLLWCRLLTKHLSLSENSKLYSPSTDYEILALMDGHITEIYQHLYRRRSVQVSKKYNYIL